MEEQCASSIDILRRIGINFVGIDFDKTFIARHTGGRWQGDAPELASYARAEFVQLVPALMNNGIHVAIVTFSGQTHLIEQVLQISLGAEVASKIVVRARDKSWGVASDHNTSRNSDGKHKFLASAAEQFERQNGAQITRNSTLLIDDDHNNITIALDRGVRALWFIPEEPENLWAQITGMPLVQR